MRYEKEVKLRFIGDKAEAKKYITQGRTILGEVYNRDVEIGGLEQAWRRVTLSNGVRIFVHYNSWMPLIEIDVAPRPPDDAPLAELHSLKLAWLPEGIVLTPVNDESPDGWGLPTRTKEDQPEIPAGTILNPPYEGVPPEDLEVLLVSAETVLASPFGTEGGIQPQVLLNRFVNNKYLDKKEHIAGLEEEVLERITPVNPRLRATYAEPYASSGYTFITQWQLLYNPLICPSPPLDDGSLYWQELTDSPLAQVPGLYTLTSVSINETDVSVATLEIPQFSDDFYTSAIYEVESGQWYCHRPEELLYGVPAHEGCFQETNRIRADVGRGAMYRQTRGNANLARMAVDEVGISHKLFHEHDDFRFGYRKIGARAMNGVGRGVAGDNLLSENTFPIESEQSGRDIAIIWENSTPHYNNQVNTEWDNPAFPGAEHHVAYLNTTVDEGLYAGAIDPPLIGQTAGQVFSKQDYWVPPSSHHHEGTYGVTSFFGSQQTHGREHRTAIPYVTFAGHMYYLEQYESDDDFQGVIGCAAYKDGTVLLLRIVVLIYDDTLLDLSTGDVTVKVLTRPVRLTDDYGCDWTEEYTYTFANSDGWFPYPTSTVAFAPDGDKFLLSMLKTTHEYSTALDTDATDFETERSATVRARKTVLVHFIEYTTPENEFVITPVDAPQVNITATTTDALVPGDHENIYKRILKTSTPIFAAYDAEGEIQYVYAEIDEYTYQRWKDVGADPETESYGYRFRQLRFPSGKLVTYAQQYMQDSETVSDLGELATYAWPGEYSEGSFIRRIAHLDVITEDIIYHHIEWVSLMDSSDQFFETVRGQGTQWLAIDLGFDDERIQETVWEGEETLWAYQQNIKLTGYEHTDSDNRPRTTHDWPMHVSIETTKGIYCMDQAPMSWWVQDSISSNFYYMRQIFPTPYAFFDDAAGVPDTTTIMYNGTDGVDSPFGRPPAENFYASVAPGLSGQTGGDNTYPSWNPLVWGSLQTGNIAPQMANDSNARCKIVRYKDRIVVRIKTERIPYAIPNPTQDTWPEVDAFYLDVPEDLSVVLYTNFDLDEAVGMVDVTDIFPFGRV